MQTTLQPAHINALSLQAVSLEQRTILSLIEEFLRAKKSTETKKAYKKDLIVFFWATKLITAWDLIQYPIHQLSDAIIQHTESFKKTEQYREDRVLNPRTVNRKAYAISSFFEFLVATYGYPRNPAKVFTPYATPTRTSTDALDADELWAVRDYAQSLPTSAKTLYQRRSAFQKMLIIALLMLSLRRNEAANCRRDDIDRDKNVLTVFGKWQKYKYIPLPSKIVHYLQEFKRMKHSFWLSSEYIFSPLRNNSTSNFDKPLSWTSIFQIVKEIAHYLQLEWRIDITKTITPHSFRTTFVKLSLEKECTDIEIMNATGHATAQMVKYYDARSQIEVNAARGMEDVF